MQATPTFYIKKSLKKHFPFFWYSISVLKFDTLTNLDSNRKILLWRIKYSLTKAISYSRFKLEISDQEWINIYQYSTIYFGGAWSPIPLLLQLYYIILIAPFYHLLIKFSTHIYFISFFSCIFKLILDVSTTSTI